VSLIVPDKKMPLPQEVAFFLFRMFDVLSVNQRPTAEDRFSPFQGPFSILQLLVDSDYLTVL
jgi:hypothetical protein